MTPQRGLGVVGCAASYVAAPVPPRDVIPSCIKMQANLLEKQMAKNIGSCSSSRFSILALEFSACFACLSLALQKQARTWQFAARRCKAARQPAGQAAC